MLLVIKFLHLILHLSPQNYKILHGFSNYFTKKSANIRFMFCNYNIIAYICVIKINNINT